MTLTKPHIILIPGAWHDQSSFDSIVPLLKYQGYEVTALTLPSVGADPPATSLDPDVDHIQRTLTPIVDDGKEIVLCMHSYGGVAGASALRGLSKQDRERNGLRGGVVALVYICAWMIPEGQTIREAGGGRGGKGGAKRIREENGKIYHLDPINAFYNDLPLEEAQQHASKLTHHSLLTLLTPSTYAAHQFIPSTYLACAEDDTIPYERQMKLVEDAEAPVTTFSCNAGHSPFLSQPELTVRVIRHAAGEVIKVNQ